MKRMAIAAALFGLCLSTSPTLAEFGEKTLIKHPGFEFQQGPSKAKGIIIWSPGFSNGHPKAATASMPHFLDWVYGHGWDVYFMQREGGYRHTDRPRHAAAIQNAVKGLREAGYKRIVLGGQSSGGTYSLLAAEQNLNLHAIILTASGPSTGSVPFKQMLSNAKAGKFLIAHFANDKKIGQRNESQINAVLSQKGRPFSHIYEPVGIEGHSSAFLSTFSKRFAGCILRFLNSGQPSRGICSGK